MLLTGRFCTGCPTTYQTQHFFNNSKTNEDIAARFEQEYVHCVRNEEECVCSVCLFRCNIFIGFRIIKEMPSLVGSGTPYITKMESVYYAVCTDSLHDTDTFVFKGLMWNLSFAR